MKILIKLATTLLFCFTIVSCYAGNPITNDLTRIQKMYGLYTDDIIIYPGNMVEVTSEVYMAIGKKIVVSPGAILKIFNQTITSDHVQGGENLTQTHLWHGI